MLEGLTNAGFNLNTKLSDFYTAYRADHPTISPFVQDWTLPEPPASTYSSELMDNAKSFSDTALIVLSRTGAEHADLPTDMTDVEGIWAGSQMFSAAYTDNSAVWCAGPGQNGFNALGTVLNGETNPSGRAPDTFVTDFSQTPYINNFGRFTYDNMTDFHGDSWGDPTTPTFVNYVEGIYLGYKFYETAAAEGLIDYDTRPVGW